jgi:hypothetical protein
MIFQCGFEFEVPERDRANRCRNFKFAALAPGADARERTSTLPEVSGSGQPA